MPTFDTNLATNQELPYGRMVVENSQPCFEFRGMMPELVMVATEDVSLENYKSITMTIEHSDDNVNFSEYCMPEFCMAMADKNTWSQYDTIMRMQVPSFTKKYIRIVLSADDANVSGKVDVLFNYVHQDVVW